MKWTYDPAVDALTILFLEGRASALTREVGIGLLWDFDRNGHPVSIEILHASTHFPVRKLNKLAPPDDVMPLSEAAKRIGLDVSTLRHQIRNKRLKATKRHREWWVKGSDIEAYLENRAPQGRRGKNERPKQQPQKILATMRRARARIDRVFLKDESLTSARNSGRA